MAEKTKKGLFLECALNEIYTAIEEEHNRPPNGDERSHYFVTFSKRLNEIERHVQNIMVILEGLTAADARKLSMTPKEFRALWRSEFVLSSYLIWMPRIKTSESSVSALPVFTRAHF